MKTTKTSSPLLVPSSPDLSLEAYQRSATLMGADTPGSQGRVQVWAPDKRRIRTVLSVSGTVFLASGWVMVSLHSGGFWMWLLTVLPFWLAISIALLCSVAAASSAFYCVNALMALPALWKPCYITADDTGVGITSWFGSRATRWDDIIASTRYDILYHQILYTRSGMPLLLNTCGYPKAVIDEVGEVVKERSRLVRRDQTWWRHALYGRSYSGYFREGYHMVFPDSLVKDRPLPPPPEVDALTEGETHQ